MYINKDDRFAIDTINKVLDNIEKEEVKFELGLEDLFSKVDKLIINTYKRLIETNTNIKFEDIKNNIIMVYKFNYKEYPWYYKIYYGLIRKLVIKHCTWDKVSIIEENAIIDPTSFVCTPHGLFRSIFTEKEDTDRPIRYVFGVDESLDDIMINRMHMFMLAGTGIYMDRLLYGIHKLVSCVNGKFLQNVFDKFVIKDLNSEGINRTCYTLDRFSGEKVNSIYVTACDTIDNCFLYKLLSIGIQNVIDDGGLLNILVLPNTKINYNGVLENIVHLFEDIEHITIKLVCPDNIEFRDHVFDEFVKLIVDKGILSDETRLHRNHNFLMIDNLKLKK